MSFTDTEFMEFITSHLTRGTFLLFVGIALLLIAAGIFIGNKFDCFKIGFILGYTGSWIMVIALIFIPVLMWVLNIYPIIEIIRMVISTVILLVTIFLPVLALKKMFYRHL